MKDILVKALLKIGKTKKKGGGLITYFAHHIKYERLSNSESEQIESMWFKLHPLHEQPF